MPASPAATPSPVRPRSPGRSWLRGLLWTLIVLLALFLLGEALGWPFLRQPIENQVSKALGVPVRIEAPFSLRLLAPRVRAARVTVAAPEGSGAPLLLDVKQLIVAGRWTDAWRFRRDGVIRLKHLEADGLDVNALHAAKSPATWEFPGLPPKPPAAEDKPFVWPEIDRLLVRRAHVKAREDAKQVTLDLKATLCDSDAQTCAAQQLPVGFQADGQGAYMKNPIQVHVGSPAPLALMDAEAHLQAPLVVRIRVGGASGQFDGVVTDLLGTQSLEGTVKVRGESMAKLGEPFGLTLPTTGPFDLLGALKREGQRWTLGLKKAQVGKSELHGDFVFDLAPTVPVLTGTVMSNGFVLADFAPAIGAAPPGVADASPSTVLPSKPFDIPSLRRMNADVRFNFERLTLGTGVLESLQPLKAHVVLSDGVLKVEDIVAQTAGGSLTGATSLDGRADIPLWKADLAVKGVDLAGWVKGARQSESKVDARSSRKQLRQERQEALKEGAPVHAYLTGELQASLDLKGAGRSTAEILGGSSGQMRAHVREGTVSHLALELAGFDLAQGLGIFDFKVDKGVAILQRGAMDTRDSVVVLSGHTDLKKESMEFVAEVKPKDATILSLRSPVRIVGTYAHPDVKLDKGSIAARLVAGVALAAVAPPAAIVPFIDMGETVESPCFTPVASAQGKRDPRPTAGKK
jgi:uncharacterized protein involved in outer membrane biogenesis